MKTAAVKTKTETASNKSAGHLPSEVFGLKVNHDLVHQVVVCQQANRRQGNAHAKDRSEVSGGGKKPWRQKGTGRARHGSIRSPLWRGGGITFGPRNERVYQKTIPAKMRKTALLMALSAKNQSGLLLIVDELAVTEPKTKQVLELLKNLKINGTVLFVTESYNESFWKAGRNIAGVSVIEARNLNTLEVMSFKYLVLEKSAVDKIKSMFTV